MDKKITFSLFEVSQRIKNALELEFPTTVWIVGEISEIKENPSGHCYLELVEKDTDNDQPKAKARATIWSRSFRMIKPFFETSTGRRLGAGIKVLVQCVINYHPLYGLSVNIVDIDPTFTIGDLEMVRQQTINRLIAEGVMGMNNEIPLPLLPKRIAVISSPTAAGFEDFANQLHNNSYGYAFFVKLFAASMQGDKAEESIINALERINESVDMWDIVAIIRGGGSQIDLGCFDNYNLANNIAQFPIPVVTGIGHEKDVSIADMVAHTRLKTPTAVAEFFINQFVNAENWLMEANDDFTDAVKHVVGLNVQTLSKISNRIIPSVIRSTQYENIRLQKIIHSNHEEATKFLGKSNLILNKFTNRFNIHVKLAIGKKNQELKQYKKWLMLEPKTKLGILTNELKQIERNLHSVDPKNVLKRGFSITLYKGKPLKNGHDINPSDEVETILCTGKLVSVVKEVKRQ